MTPTDDTAPAAVTTRVPAVRAAPSVVRSVVTALAVGTVLGVGALLADVLPGAIAVVFLVLCSTTIAWGVGALIAGSWQPHWWKATLSGVAALVLANWVYYGGILTFGLRPNSDASTVLGAAAEWTLLAAVVGGSFGLIGHVATWARGATSRAIALGIWMGGAYALAYWEARGTARMYQDVLPSPYLASMIGALILTVVLALPALRWLRPQPPTTTPATVTVATVASAGMGVAVAETVIQLVLHW